MTEDLAGRQFWQSTWDGRTVLAPMNPRDRSLDNHMNRVLDDYLRLAIKLASLPVPGRPNRLIEIGCGGSTILPYFQREWGFEIAGIDYAVSGVEISRAIVEAAAIPCDVRQADMFEPPADLLNAFDVVYSTGLVEHFDPTATAIAALARFARPGGVLITLIPNMRGLPGMLQRLLNRSVFDKHVPLDERQLVEAHRACGLTILDSRLIGTLNLSALNFSGGNARISEPVGLRVASWITKSTWLAHRAGIPELPNRVTSPKIACLARRPG